MRWTTLIRFGDMVLWMQFMLWWVAKSHRNRLTEVQQKYRYQRPEETGSGDVARPLSFQKRQLSQSLFTNRDFTKPGIMEEQFVCLLER